MAEFLFPVDAQRCDDRLTFHQHCFEKAVSPSS
jgi:hypothetical protein